MFDRQHIVDGGKLGESFIKRCQGDDPRVALIAAAELLVAACKVTGFKRKDVMILIDALSQQDQGDARSALEIAVSNIPRIG